MITFMGKKAINIFGYVVLIVSCIGIAIGMVLDWERWVWWTKPWLAPSIMLIFWAGWKRSEDLVFWHIIIGLLFSWMGDLFLMIPKEFLNGEILGISSFSLAMINYISAFYYDGGYWGKDCVLYRQPQWLIGVVTAVIVGIFLISKHFTGLLGILVPMYAVLLPGMMLIAVNRRGRVPDIGYFRVARGAMLFVVADVFLAFLEIYYPVRYGHIPMMAGYVAAQYMIATGLLKR